MHKQLLLLIILATPLLHASPKLAEADVKTLAPLHITVDTSVQTAPCIAGRKQENTGFWSWIGSAVGLTVYSSPRRCICSECTSTRLITRWREAEDDREARQCIENIAWHLVQHFFHRVYGHDNNKLATKLHGTVNDLDLKFLDKLVSLPAHTHEFVRTACAAHFYELMWKNNGNALTNSFFVLHRLRKLPNFLLPELLPLIADYVGPHYISFASFLYYTPSVDRSPLHLDRSTATSNNQGRRRTNICTLRYINDLNGIESLDHRSKVIDCSQGCEITHMPEIRMCVDANEVPDLENLTDINLANNLIRTIRGASISQHMLSTTLPKLAHINLANNKIEALDEDFYKELAACGPRAHGRKITIDLRENPLTEKTRKRLAAFAHVRVGAPDRN